MVPTQIKYDPNATPPQFTDNEDYRIEPGTHIRVKIMGMRSEVGNMWAIGTVNEDYLGYFTPFCRLLFWRPLLKTNLHENHANTLHSVHWDREIDSENESHPGGWHDSVFVVL